MDTFSISVVISTYERPEYLLTSLDSVLRQSTQPLEVIVVNDSPNCNYGICAELLTNKKVKTLSTLGHRGANSARNMGVNAAQGDIVAFLDDDDIWFDTYLEVVLLTYQKTANLAATVCGKRILEKPKELVINQQEFVSKQELQKGNTFCGFSGFTCLKSVLQSHKLDESLSNAQDWDLYIRLNKANMKIQNIKKVLFDYRTEVTKGITKSNHIYVHGKAEKILEASIKHKEWLGTTAFNARVSWMTLNNIKRKSHKIRWIALCAKHIGWPQTMSALYKKIYSMEKTVK